MFFNGTRQKTTKYTCFSCYAEKNEREAEGLFFSERQKIYQISVQKIRPNPSQPRKYFDPKRLEELAESIRQNGLLQPISVRRKANDSFELIAGERRLKASKMAGLTEVPCIIVECTDRQSAVFSLLENLQRSDLQLFEEAEGLLCLIQQWGMTQEEAAARIGKSQSAIANKLRILRIPPHQRKIIAESGLTERHARALVRIEDTYARQQVLEEIIKKRLNVSQTDKMVARYLETEKEKKKTYKRTFIAKDIRIFINTIDRAIDTMKLAGIPAETKRKETEEYIECVVRIPKEIKNAG